MDKEEISSLIKQKTWYHRYELLPGVITPGKIEVEPRKTLDAYGAPGKLAGQEVLDIGAWDGAYTFEFERRGAKVTALDIQDPDRTGFNVSKKILKSNALYICASVYDLPHEFKNKFDIVFYSGVYYHLKNPLLAFMRIWDSLKPNGMIYFAGSILSHTDPVDAFWKDKIEILEQLSSLPVAYFVKDAYGKFNDPSCWFIPTPCCLRDWLSATGYKEICIESHSKTGSAFGKAFKDANFQDFEHGKM
jgi:tRNA (mo5U34)-methyltransferase